MKLPAADRLICASNTAERRNCEKSCQEVSHKGRVERTDVLTIHLTMTYLQWRFKYRTDLKLLLRPHVTPERRADLEGSFPGQYGGKKADVMFTQQTL